MTSLERSIALALGEEPVDLLVRGCRLVNVLSGDIHETDVAFADGICVGFGAYEAKEVLEARGRHMVPGLIDGHIHIESTLLTPPRFAEVAAARGTAAVVCDPHEIANVLGRAGVEYMLRASEGLPLGVYAMVPSCVPATHLETSGAVLSAEDVAYFLARWPDRVLGLAEVMNFPGVLRRDPSILAKLEAARGRVIDGHAPLLTGRELAAYVMAGPGSDHECTTREEAREKLRLGLHLMIREGTAERNLDDLLPVLNEANACRVSLVTDDRHPLDLIEHGHLDHCVRKAIRGGVNPVRAVQMASLNAARYFGLRRRGAIAPGYRADFTLLDDLESFAISEVYLAGQNVRELSFAGGAGEPPASPMRVARLDESIFRLPAGSGSIRVIGLVPNQIVTKALIMSPRLIDGRPESDPERDIAKLAVIERHRATGDVGLGFVQGLGLRRGAIASSVAHDSHNVIVAGTNDADMVAAAKAVIEAGGGFAAALDGQVRALLELPVAGLMSDRSIGEVAAKLQSLDEVCRDLGPTIPNPFMSLSFLALPVIPALKLTDKGLADVTRFEIVGLWA